MGGRSTRPRPGRILQRGVVCTPWGRLLGPHIAGPDNVYLATDGARL
jgi:hypothetical protein